LFEIHPVISEIEQAETACCKLRKSHKSVSVQRGLAPHQILHFLIFIDNRHVTKNLDKTYRQIFVSSIYLDRYISADIYRDIPIETTISIDLSICISRNISICIDRYISRCIDRNMLCIDRDISMQLHLSPDTYRYAPMYIDISICVHRYITSIVYIYIDSRCASIIDVNFRQLKREFCLHLLSVSPSSRKCVLN
jgi:hypothetical protein